MRREGATAGTGRSVGNSTLTPRPRFAYHDRILTCAVEPRSRRRLGIGAGSGFPALAVGGSESETHLPAAQSTPPSRTRISAQDAHGQRTPHPRAPTGKGKKAPVGVRLGRRR